MAGEVESALRGPNGYDLARQAVESMQRHQVWPTPLNFELWLYFLAEPQSALGKEFQRLLGEGGPFTEALAEELKGRRP